MSIKEEFDHISKKYDDQRKQLIPCFDDYYNLPLSVMDFEGECPKVLDIGCGTGLFSSILLKKYPKAQITLIDLSNGMMDIAKRRFINHPSFQFIVDDYTTHEFDETFDIIISALSIHHLSAVDKENLYQTCYNMLNDHGLFINADQVLSPSQAIEKMHTDLWKEFVESSGLRDEEIQRAYERVALDDPSTLAEQLRWLDKAGFRHADSIYKYYHFCVLYAKK